MQYKLILRLLLGTILASALFSPGGSGLAVPSAPELSPEEAPADGYAMEFISTAATGIAMNDAGVVVGTSYPDPGCGSFCLPSLQTVVWRGAGRYVLPSIPGLSGITVSSINNLGWIAGYAGISGTTTHAVLWKPSGDTYQALDLGTLPGTSISYAVGIDNLGRVIGWSTTLNFPPDGSPFMWTEASGMIDLSALGFPDEAPLAISPNGAVATPGYWYQLDDPGSVVAMPEVPQGFYPPGTYGTAINDLGDQARFLISTGGQNLAYLFRFHHQGSWQQISNVGNGHLAPFGVGSINNAGDVSATIIGSAVIAYGPEGLAESLTPLLTSAYQGSSVTMGGPMNSSGQILAKVMIGQSQRLVRLTPAKGCSTDCLQVSSLVMGAKFIQDPQNPGMCYQGGTMYNTARVVLTVTNETGVGVKGVIVRGRFLDDYWTNAMVKGVTNDKGSVAFSYNGTCGVGAIAFVVDNAIKLNLSFDKTAGILTGWTIPK